MKSKYYKRIYVDIHNVTIGDIIGIIKTNDIEAMRVIFRSANKIKYIDVLCKWILDIPMWEGKPLSVSNELKTIAMRELNDINKLDVKEDIAL